MGRSCINFIRITSLLWAKKLVKYGLYNMQDYLTDDYKLSFHHAAGILNVMGGISLILEVFLLFLVDERLARYKTMVLISSIALGLGVGFITLSSTNHEGLHKEPVVYTGMILVAIGKAGSSVFIPLLIEEQQADKSDNNINGENDQKLTRKLRQLFFTAINSTIPRLGAVALAVFITRWELNFGIPTIAVVLATLIFLSGWRKYHSNTHCRGSPLMNFCRVLVASARKWLEPSTKLDERDNLFVREREDTRECTDTRCLGCLQKAAIKQDDSSIKDQEKNRWKLCSVEEVEEAKVIVRMIPISMTFLIWGIVSSVGDTYFMEQTDAMIGDEQTDAMTGDEQTNAAKYGEIILVCYAMAEVSFRNLAEWLLKKTERISAAPSIGIAVAMVLSAVCCVASAVVEGWRLKSLTTGQTTRKQDDSMCIYWFIFQFSLLGSIDGIFEKSIGAFYNQQAPDSMKKYADHFANGAEGMGYMCSVFSVYVARKISKIRSNHQRSWFEYNLNHSQLDKYYWVIAGLSLVNLAVFLVFVAVAACYRYRKPVENRSPSPG